MPKKSWSKMTAEKWAKETRKFDTPRDWPEVKPSAKELAKHLKAMQPRGRGRPRLGKGAARVLFSIEPAFLIKMDAFARKHGMKRSHLITVGVEAYMKEHRRPESDVTSAPTVHPTPLAARSG
jgi:hypothetical protein